MKQIFKKSGMLLFAGVLALQGCQKDDQFNPSDVSMSQGKSQTFLLSTFYSKTYKLGNGTVRAWVQENKSGEPVAVGVNLSETLNTPGTLAHTGALLILRPQRLLCDLCG